MVRSGVGVLLVRLTYSRHRGKFMFPGGKVEPGESLEAALAREVREETGIDAAARGIVAVRHRVDTDELNTYVMFLMDHTGGDPNPTSSEADAVGIFDLDDFRQRPQLFVGMVPEIAVPVLESRHALLASNPFEPAGSGYDRETFRVYGPTA